MPRATRTGATNGAERVVRTERLSGVDIDLTGSESDLHVGGNLDVAGSINGFPMTRPAARLDRAVRTTGVTINAVQIGDMELVSQTVVTVADLAEEVKLCGHAHLAGNLAAKSVILGICPAGASALSASLEETHSETSSNVAIPRLLTPEVTLPAHSAGTYQLYVSTLDFTGLNITVSCAASPPRHAWLEVWTTGETG